MSAFKKWLGSQNIDVLFSFWLRCEPRCRCAVPVPAALPIHMAAPMGARAQPTALWSWICQFRKALRLVVALPDFHGASEWRSRLEDTPLHAGHICATQLPPPFGSFPVPCPTVTIKLFCGVQLCYGKGIQDNTKLT